MASKKIGKLSKSMIIRRKPRETTGFVLREKPPATGTEIDGDRLSGPLSAGETVIVPRHAAPEAAVPRGSAKVVPLHPPADRAAEAPIVPARAPLAPPPESEASNDHLVQALRSADLRRAESLFGHLAGLGSVQVLQVLYGTSGEDLALACRALGMDQLQFVSVYILSRKLGLGEEALAPQELARLVALFEASDLGEAREHLKALQGKEGGSPAGPLG